MKINKPVASGLNITTTDKYVSSVKSLKRNLAEQVEMLSNGIEESSVAAREAVKENNRHKALHYLRSKRLREKMLHDRSKMLTQVEEALTKIDDTESQVEFVKAMKQTTSVLRNINGEVGDIENVAKIIDDLQVEMANVEETSVFLGDRLKSSLVDESEIDQEAAALEADLIVSSDPKEKKVDLRLETIQAVPSRIYNETSQDDKHQATDPSQVGTTVRAFEGMNLG